jgi:hypothetical protein
MIQTLLSCRSQLWIWLQHPNQKFLAFLADPEQAIQDYRYWILKLVGKQNISNVSSLIKVPTSEDIIEKASYTKYVALWNKMMST